MINKKWILISVVSVIAVISATVVALSNPSFVTPLPSSPSGQTVSVQGTGKVTVVPDMMIVSVGVETKSKDVASAQSENRERMNRIYATLEKQGVKKENIRTSSYQVYPDYQYDEKVQNTVQVGYRVSHLIDVTIQNLDTSGNIVDQISKNDANMVQNVRFASSKEKEIYSHALQAAVKDANLKAEAIISSFGAKKATPILITEQGSSHFSPSPIYGVAKMAAEASGGSTTFTPGESEIVATVMVQYGF